MPWIHVCEFCSGPAAHSRWVSELGAIHDGGPLYEIGLCQNHFDRLWKRCTRRACREEEVDLSASRAPTIDVRRGEAGQCSEFDHVLRQHVRALLRAGGQLRCYYPEECEE